MVRVEYLYILLLAVVLFESLYRNISGQVVVLIGIGLFLFAALSQQFSGNDLAERIGNLAYLTIAAGVLVVLIDSARETFGRPVDHTKGSGPREEGEDHKSDT